MQLPKALLLLVALPAALGAAIVGCQLGDNKCDDTNVSVMVCKSRGWTITEPCSKVGACHVGPAGNAYCDKEPECYPGESKCDATDYVSKFCNDRGVWQTDRKCSKPGCCEVQDGKAVCKAECGPGQELMAMLSTPKVTVRSPRPGDRCTPVGEGWCDDDTHRWILRCNGNKIIYE